MTQLRLQIWGDPCVLATATMRSLMSQVLALLSRTWLHDRLAVGDRPDGLADRKLPWKDVVFAPSAACAITAE